MNTKTERYITVSYPLEWWLSTPHGDLETQIENLAPRNVSGSGAGFGKRDINFSFKTDKGADNFVERLEKWIDTLPKKIRRRFKINDEVIEE